MHVFCSGDRILAYKIRELYAITNFNDIGCTTEASVGFFVLISGILCTFVSLFPTQGETEYVVLFSKLVLINVYGAQ